jgi:hypothetical protein
VPKGHFPHLPPPPPRPGVPGHEPARQAPPSPITFDDPEDEDWFQRLPDAAKEDVRRAWAAKAARASRREDLAKSTLHRSLVQATLVFLFTETACCIPSWGHTAAANVAGLLVGWVWNRVGAGRYRCMTTSILPFVVMRVAFVADGYSFSFAAWCIYAVLGFLMLLALTAAVGFIRERRVDDDLDA